MFQRTEKGKEYHLFVLKIQKLEKLCRALQEERVVLYDKIKEVRQAGSASRTPGPGGSALLTPTEVQELQEEDPVLTEDMSRLQEEQAKLQEFAASLLATPLGEEEQEGGGEEEEPGPDAEEDEVSLAFSQFRTRTQTVPEQAEGPAEEVKGQSRDGEAAAAAAQEPPGEPEPTRDPAELKPEASSQTSEPVLDGEEREDEATVAPPPDAESDTAKKPTSKKKKKKKNSKNVS